jgi:succinylarginine dihydrolase
MRISVNLDQAELNELIYALGMHYQNKLANKEVADPLEDKLREALNNLNDMVDLSDEQYLSVVNGKYVVVNGK